MHLDRFRRLLFMLALPIAFAQSSEPIQLVGVGSTFPVQLYSLWGQSFQSSHPGTRIKYMPFGSSEGVQMLISGTADFGGTDAPMTDKQLVAIRVLHFPTVLGAIVPVYNLPESNIALRFSPKALAGIYLGTITHWDDPAIAALNPETQLPSSKIVVIHSTGGRGSTYIWSDYLTKVSAEWRSRVGRGVYVKWPVGQEADGNGNLAKMVKATEYSIGYVELSYAMRSKLSFGAVQNSVGNFVSADSSSITAAAVAKPVPADFRISVTDSAGDRSYPIASFTWILVPENIDSSKREAMKDFLRWALSDGQNYAESAGFTRLPKAIVDQEMKAIDGIP